MSVLDQYKLKIVEMFEGDGEDGLICLLQVTLIFDIHV